MMCSSPMAEFPPNLDDGELWLPSDIFLNEIVPFNYASFSGMDNYQYARHLAAISLLRNHPLPNCHKPTLHLAQRVKPTVGNFSVNRVAPPGCFRFHGAVQLGQTLLGYETSSLFAWSDPFCKFRVQPQVASCLETRAGFLQRQLNRQFLNRVQPFCGSGFGPGAVKESGTGGTGVFHPRIVKPTTVTTTCVTDARKTQGTTQEIHVTGQRNHMTTKAASKLQEDCYYHLPPEMGLPQDWTY